MTPGRNRRHYIPQLLFESGIVSPASETPRLALLTANLSDFFGIRAILPRDVLGTRFELARYN